MCFPFLFNTLKKKKFKKKKKEKKGSIMVKLQTLKFSFVEKGMSTLISRDELSCGLIANMKLVHDTPTILAMPAPQIVNLRRVFMA